jgi:WD40 repeat protein
MGPARTGIAGLALLCSVALLPAAAAAPLPANGEPATLEEAWGRAKELSVAASTVDEWVTANRDEAFKRRFPKLSRSMRGEKEDEDAFRVRFAEAQRALDNVVAELRKERVAWLAAERKAITRPTYKDRIATKVGDYQLAWRSFPVLLGWGWPSSLKISVKVSEIDSLKYPKKFPESMDAYFRFDDRGDIYIVTLDRGAVREEMKAELVVSGPRLMWQGAHESWITGVAFRPGAPEVVSVGGDGDIVCWDSEKGAVAWKVPDAEMALTLAFFPDGSAFLTGASDGRIRARDGNTGSVRWESDALGAVYASAVSPNGKLVATGDASGALRIYSSEDGQLLQEAALTSPVQSVVFTGDSLAVAAGTDEGHVHLVEAESAKVLWKAAVGGPVYALAASPDGASVAAGGAGEFLRVLMRHTGQERFKVDTDGEVRSVRYDHSGRYIAWGGAGYTAHLVSDETGESLWKAYIGSPIRSLDVGFDGNRLVVGSSDFQVRSYDVVAGDRVVAAMTRFGRIYLDRKRLPELLKRPQ